MAEIQLVLNLIASICIPLLTLAYFMCERIGQTLNAENKRLKTENARLVHALDRSWQRTIDFPFSQVCKHYAASNTLDEMERAGIDTPKWVVEAVVNCDDMKALSYKRGESTIEPPDSW